MAGAKHKGTLGTACLAFLGWAGQRLVNEEELIVHENVESFPVTVLEQCLPIYVCHSLILNPVDLGWPVRRPRRITILIHRSKAHPFMPLPVDTEHSAIFLCPRVHVTCPGATDFPFQSFPSDPPWARSNRPCLSHIALYHSSICRILGSWGGLYAYVSPIALGPGQIAYGSVAIDVHAMQCSMRE